MVDQAAEIGDLKARSPQKDTRPEWIRDPGGYANGIYQSGTISSEQIPHFAAAAKIAMENSLDIDPGALTWAAPVWVSEIRYRRSIGASVDQQYEGQMLDTLETSRLAPHSEAVLYCDMMARKHNAMFEESAKATEGIVEQEKRASLERQAINMAHKRDNWRRFLKPKPGDKRIDFSQYPPIPTAIPEFIRLKPVVVQPPVAAK